MYLCLSNIIEHDQKKKEEDLNSKYYGCSKLICSSGIFEKKNPNKLPDAKYVDKMDHIFIDTF